MDRAIFLNTVANSSSIMAGPEYRQEVETALASYEEACAEVAGAGVDIVAKDFTYNWDYTQACFFALTILTTIGKYIS